MDIPKVMGTEIEYGIYVGESEEEILRQKDYTDDFLDKRTGRLLRATGELVNNCPSSFVLFSDRKRKNRFLCGKDLYGNVLFNGSRFYQDHTHPELATPECLSPRDLVIWEKAGERIVEESRRRTSLSLNLPIIIYKDNCDRKQASFGAHENYLVSPEIFEELVGVRGKRAQAWISFLVTRQIWAGAGKVSRLSPEEEFRYQISQRADFIYKIADSETTFARPIINTRNIPYANPEKFRRLHVIAGDANMSEYAIWLKVGLSAFLLEILEEGRVPDDLPILKHPVHEFKRISRDLAMREFLELDSGRYMTAVQIQKWFSDWFSNWYFSFYVPKKGRNSSLEDLLNEYHVTADTLERSPRALADRLDCWIKLKVLEDYRSKYGFSWDHWRVQAIDMAYHNIQKEKSIFYYLQEKGRIKRIVSDWEIEKALLEPPSDTRAYFRSFCLKRFLENIKNVGWDRVVFRGSAVPRVNDFVVDHIVPFWGSKKDCEGFEPLSFREFRQTLKKEKNLRLRRRLL